MSSQTQMPLRIPTSLHNALKEAAAGEGVSLNQYCLYLLSKGLPDSHVSQTRRGEELLQFLSEAQVLQEAMAEQGGAAPGPSGIKNETPIERWRRLYGNT